MPAPEVFPTEKIGEACQYVLKNLSNIALQYGATEGYQPLREMIARHTARLGIGHFRKYHDHLWVAAGSRSAW